MFWKKDIFEIYIPLFYSDDIKSTIDYYGVNFMQRIRFVLNLNELNPFKMVKNIFRKLPLWQRETQNRCMEKSKTNKGSMKLGFF